MAGKGNPMPGPHLNGFPMPAYSYFFPHMLGSLSPPAMSGLPISGYSTPSPAMFFHLPWPLMQIQALLFKELSARNPMDGSIFRKISKMSLFTDNTEKQRNRGREVSGGASDGISLIQYLLIKQSYFLQLYGLSAPAPSYTEKRRPLSPGRCAVKAGFFQTFEKQPLCQNQIAWTEGTRGK
ncbi:hypothetical protein PAMP_010489 [Pampus punctatissimus]